MVQSISLFAELMGYRPPPGEFKMTDLFMRGAIVEAPDHSILFGPAVVYDPLKNDLKLMTKPFSAGREDTGPVAAGPADGKSTSRQGADVFLYLKESIKIK